MSHYIRFDPTNPPPPLMTNDPGFFIHHTMTVRLPAIIPTVLADHAGLYPPPIIHALQELYEELRQNQPLQPLLTTAPDGPTWTEAWRPYQGRRWLDLPWYFAEAFFYRRLLEAAGYFGLGETVEGQDREKVATWVGVDPFWPQKQAELQSETTWQVLTAALTHITHNTPTELQPPSPPKIQNPKSKIQNLQALLHHCVWGNRIDLSYNQVRQASGDYIRWEREQANLLVDDTEAVLAYLQKIDPPQTETANQLTTVAGQRSPVARRLDFICDNAGVELLLDLALADLFLTGRWAEQVTLHVKALPTYVSDTTAVDVDLTLAALKAHKVPELVALATRLEHDHSQQRLQVRPDLFWNSPHFFWEMPATLQAELAQAHLVVIKGDANYRRLLGDSRWPTTVPAAAAVPYFPAPFVALRTLKSEPIVGLKPGQAELLDQQDPNWRVNGQRGSIQFVAGEKVLLEQNERGS